MISVRASCLAPNRPRAKGRSFDFVVMLPTIREVPIRTVEGDDRGRVALGARSTAHRLRGRVVPCCPAPSQITNTLAGYRTAELSDSPRASVMPPVRPSASVTPAACRSEVVRPPCRQDVSAHIAHCSGRGAPSRVASPARQATCPRWAFPLDRAPRPLVGDMCAETIRVWSSFSSLHETNTYAHLQNLRSRRIGSQLAGTETARPVHAALLRLHPVRPAYRPAKAGQSLRRQVALSAAAIAAAIVAVWRRLLLGSGLVMAGAVRPGLVSAMHCAGAGRDDPRRVEACRVIGLI